MPRQDPAILAAALRENLRKRKGQEQGHVPQPSCGADEEGDVLPDADGDPAGWVREGSKRL